MFRNPVDIANRALQHCGAERISVTDGFNEDSSNASECAFAYDKVRRAELRRNTWRFAIKHAILRPINGTFRLLSAPLWFSGTTYFLGSVVSDALGQIWISSANDNTGNEPGNADGWDLYFGAMAIPPWDSTDAGYYAGDVVYITPGDGTVAVYLSLLTGNTYNPPTTPAWDATASYTLDDVVTYAATNYQSIIDFNLNNTPSATTAPALWDSGTVYVVGNRVRGSDGFMYLSAANANTNNNPVTDNGTYWTPTGVLAPWTTTLTRPAGSLKWRQLSSVVLQQMTFIYPLGSGPSTNTISRNVFRLPANFLRRAPQDPKAGSSSFLGAPSGLQYDDWLFEGNFIVSRDNKAIILRFIGDMTDVRQFDDMFSEGLACRLALAVAPKITQSQAKATEIAAEYGKFMTEARTVNGIETGPEEPPEDDWITCRA